MVVLGAHAFVFESTKRTCNVQPFDPSLGTASKIPIVDGAIVYKFPYRGGIYVLIVRNALHKPHLQNNLIPPFVMRADGVTLNDTPNIHRKYPTIDNHCITFEDSNLRIPLQLSGVFSYFHTRKPILSELHESPKLFLTPDANDWNPHCQSYETNELSMITCKGELADKNQRSSDPCIFQEDEVATELSTISLQQWESLVGANVYSAYYAPTIQSSINYHNADFDNALNCRGETSKFSPSIGGCDLSMNHSLFLFDSINEPITTTWGHLRNHLKECLTLRKLNFVRAHISAAEASKPKGVSPSMIFKLWCISDKLAEGAIDQNTQLCQNNSDNALSRKFTTNDRMLRYKRIQSTFYSDTMFALTHKSVRQFKCCQVFVSDKGFVAVYPM